MECNPRATDGLLLMPAEELAAGMLAPRPETFVLEPGSQVQLALAVLADGFADQLKRLPQSIDDLAQVRDAGSGWHDPLPTLYSTLAICHSVGQSFREHTGQIVAIAGDMNWDGEHIHGMSDDDAILLTGLRLQPGQSSHMSALRPLRLTKMPGWPGSVRGSGGTASTDPLMLAFREQGVLVVLVLHSAHLSSSTT